MLPARQRLAAVGQQPIPQGKANARGRTIRCDLPNNDRDRNDLIARVAVNDTDHLVAVVVAVVRPCADVIDKDWFPVNIEERLRHNPLSS